MVFLSSNIVAGSLVLEVGRVLEPSLKINVETIYLLKLIFKIVYKSYLLLNLRQIIYEFSLKYFKSYFVTIFIKLRCNKRNLSGSVQISIINTRFCKLLHFLPTLNKFCIHTYILFIVSLTAMCQTTIYLFVSSKNQTSCTSFLQTGTWNLPNYFGCFPKVFPIFSEHRSSFEEVFQKIVVQQNVLMKYSTSAPVAKIKKALHTHLIKTELHVSNACEKNISTQSQFQFLFKNSNLIKETSSLLSLVEYQHRDPKNSCF